MNDESHMLDPEERRRQREVEPARPLRPDANDPTSDEPHSALAHPADEPDPTEYPDPYDRRPDPRDPESQAPPGAGAPSTSEPHPPQNYDDLKPVKGDREG